MKLTIRHRRADGQETPVEYRTITGHSAAFDRSDPSRHAPQVYLDLDDRQHHGARLSLSPAQARHVAKILLTAADAAEQITP